MFQIDFTSSSCFEMNWLLSNVTTQPMKMWGLNLAIRVQIPALTIPANFDLKSTKYHRLFSQMSLPYSLCKLVHKKRVHTIETESTHTAIVVPIIPPANIHVPHIPKMVAFCCGSYQSDRLFTQFDQRFA